MLTSAVDAFGGSSTVQDYAPSVSGEATESSEFVDYTESYVLSSSASVQDEVVTPSTSMLEDAAIDFSMEAAQYSSEWDYSVDTGFASSEFGLSDDDLSYEASTLESSVSQSDLDSVSGDSLVSSTEDVDLFNYEQGSDAYEESFDDTESLTLYALMGSDQNSSSTSESSSEVSQDTGGSSDSSSSSDASDQLSSGDSSSTDSPSNESSLETSTAEHWSALDYFPEQLDLAIPQLQLDSLDDLASYTPDATWSFVTTQVTTATPFFETTDSEIPEDVLIEGENVVERSLVWVSTTEWEMTESRLTHWKTSRGEKGFVGTVRPRGIESAGVKYTVTVNAAGAVTRSLTEGHSTSQLSSEDIDNSDPATGLVDHLWFTGTVTHTKTQGYSFTEQPTTLNGVPAVYRHLVASNSNGGSVSFDGGFDYFSQTGTLNSYGQRFGTNSVISSNGNGQRTDAGARLNFSGSRSSSVGVNLEVTTPVGGTIQAADVTGTVSLNTSTVVGGSSSVDFLYDDQTFEGDESNDTDTFAYLSVTFGSGGGGSLRHVIDASVPFGVTEADTIETTWEDTGADPLDASPPDMAGLLVATDQLRSPDNGNGGSGGVVGLSGARVTVDSGFQRSGGGSTSIDGDIKARDADVTTGTSIRGLDLGDRRVETLSVSGTGGGGGSVGFSMESDPASGIPAGVIKSIQDTGGSFNIVHAVITSNANFDPGMSLPDGWSSKQTIIDYKIYDESYESTGGYNYSLSIPTGEVEEFTREDINISGAWHGTASHTVTDSDYYTEHLRVYNETGALEYQVMGRWGSVWSGTFSLIGSGETIKTSTIPWHEHQGVSVYVTEGQLPVMPPTHLSPQEQEARILDNVQFVLDIAGMVPVIGEAADLLNAGIHVGRGNWGAASMSLAGVVPFGDAAKLLKYGDEALEVGGTLATKQASNMAGNASKMQDVCKNGVNCFVAGTPVVVGRNEPSLLTAASTAAIPVEEDRSGETGVAIAVAGAMFWTAAGGRPRQRDASSGRSRSGRLRRAWVPQPDAPPTATRHESRHSNNADQSQTDGAFATSASAILYPIESEPGEARLPSPGGSNIFRSMAWMTAALLLVGSVLFHSAWQSPGGLVANASTAAIDSAAAMPPHQPASLVTRNIEDIRLGQRVVGRNPLREQTQVPSDITPEHWRAVRLTMHAYGVQYDLAFLRSLDWLQATGATPGGEIHLTLPEMGLDGPALVESIDACPPLEADDVPRHGEPGRMLVTGTMRHLASNILDVSITGLDEPLGVTTTHPIWSETRQTFVTAAQLEVGEHLRSEAGVIAQVTRITPRRGPPEFTYNLEIDGEHVYEVGYTGLLVHNDCLRNGTGPFGYPSGTIDHGSIHTGRHIAETLAEKLTMAEAKAGAGTLAVAADKIGDPRFSGGQWAKFHHAHELPGGGNVVVHYMKNLLNGRAVDFKFK